MKDFKVTVRKDGAINIGKASRISLGIAPGSVVRVMEGDGQLVIKPIGYICALCGKTVSMHLSKLGFCPLCCTAIVDDIKENKSTLDTALDNVRKLNGPKGVVRK